MIQVQSLVKNYNLNPVLRGVNLHVRPGEFVSLVGPNGAGKSTLLRIIATLLKPSSGTVKVGGWPLPTHADKVRSHIGLVSHHALLYGELTASENLLFFARLYGVADPAGATQRTLKQVGLLARQRDTVRTFSRGMMQRLTIARATLHQPDVLLLDEPYTGLDRQASTQFDTLLEEQIALGRTIFMISHDLVHTLKLSHRILILNRGRIVDEVDGKGLDPAGLLQRYQQQTS